MAWPELAPSIVTVGNWHYVLWFGAEVADAFPPGADASWTGTRVERREVGGPWQTLQVHALDTPCARGDCPDWDAAVAFCEDEGDFEFRLTYEFESCSGSVLLEGPPSAPTSMSCVP